MSEETIILGNTAPEADLTEPVDASRPPVVKPGARYVVTANNLGGHADHRFARGDKISPSDLGPGVDEARAAVLVDEGAWRPLGEPVKRSYVRKAPVGPDASLLAPSTEA